MTKAAKTKNPEISKATGSILKSKSGGKKLNLTDLHSGAGLRLRVV